MRDSVGQTSGATQRCLNPGFSVRIGNSRCTGSLRASSDSCTKADAAYDTGDVYKTLENHRAHRSPKVLIPPRKGAQLALDSAGTRQRNRNIRARSRVGKRKWYVASGYSRRSKVETTFHRYKAILGSAMRARGLASQRVEVRLGCKILNTMTALGIPDGEMIG